MTPQEMQNKLDNAKEGPRFGKQAREIGQLKTVYAPSDAIDPLESVKAHVRSLDADNVQRMAKEIRRGKVLRLCNDAVLAALLVLWAR